MSNKPNKTKKFERRSKKVRKTQVAEGMEEKLVILPEQVWQELRDRGLHVPEGNFSIRYFARKLLPFTFVTELSVEAKKLLFKDLMKELVPEFDSTMCKGFAEVPYKIADQETIFDIAAMLTEEEDKAQRKKPKSVKLPAAAEEAVV